MDQVTPETVPTYVLSFNNPDRKQRLIDRFTSAGWSAMFPEPTSSNDPQIVEAAKAVNQYPGVCRVWAITFDHLKMIKAFIATGQSHGIFCEDDIYIKKTFKEDLIGIIHEFDKLKLDVLLLGYLLSHSPRVEGQYQICNSFTYHNYNNDLWGSEMYMLSRKQAIHLVETYTLEWAQKNIEKPYSPDWIITKDGKRAMIYPMLAVEEGDVNTDHFGQMDYHRRCAEFQYNSDLYV
jgi:hypothetical protein